MARPTTSPLVYVMCAGAVLMLATVHVLAAVALYLLPAGNFYFVATWVFWSLATAGVVFSLGVALFSAVADWSYFMMNLMPMFTGSSARAPSWDERGFPLVAALVFAVQNAIVLAAWASWYGTYGSVDTRAEFDAAEDTALATTYFVYCGFSAAMYLTSATAAVCLLFASAMFRMARDISAAAYLAAQAGRTRKMPLEKLLEIMHDRY